MTASHSHGETQGVRLTPGRRRVLDILHAAGRPLGAYDMIDRLADSTGKRPAPVSVYRALDFLRDHGLVHRLASRNAYMACGHSHGGDEPVIFLICDNCGCAAESTSRDMHDSLTRLMGEVGFEPRAPIIEISGRCAACHSADTIARQGS